MILIKILTLKMFLIVYFIRDLCQKHNSHREILYMWMCPTPYKGHLIGVGVRQIIYKKAITNISKYILMYMLLH